jgi:hypothetical protein
VGTASVGTCVGVGLPADAVGVALEPGGGYPPGVEVGAQAVKKLNNRNIANIVLVFILISLLSLSEL